jgi:hypothetical protein
VLHLYFATVSQEPLATPLHVILLVTKGSAGSFSLPVRLLKPLGPEAAILPVDDGVDFECLGVDDDIMLPQIVGQKGRRGIQRAAGCML